MAGSLFPINESESGTVRSGDDAAIKAGRPSGVAGTTISTDANFHDKAILIAIDPHFEQGLNLTGGFALEPERLTGAGKIPNATFR